MALARAPRSSPASASDTKMDGTEGARQGRRRVNTAGAAVKTGEDAIEDSQEEERTTRKNKGKKGSSKGAKEEDKDKKDKKKKDKKADDDILRLVAKAYMQLALRVRELEGACYDTILIPSASDVVQEMMKEGKAYSEKARKAEDRSKMGPPHIHIFHAVMEFLAGKGEVIGQRTAMRLAEMYEELKVEEMKDTAGYMRVWKLSKCYDEAKARVTIYIVEKPELRRLVLKALEELGGDHKIGRAPMGRCERLLQEYLPGDD
jgi:hypothetical protein